MNFACDGFYGVLFAIEGITDGRAVLNGPTGCRGTPAYFSDASFPRQNVLRTERYEEPFFFGLSRIPCTFLDADDYIAGAGEKLEAVLAKIAENPCGFTAVVNSPGASLIGDDLAGYVREAGIADRCMVFETAAYSKPVFAGFDMAVTGILRWMRLNRLPKSGMRVNLLGLSLYHKHWEGTRAELIKICELMGLSVVAVPCCGSTIAEIRESATASYNVVVFPEYAKETAEWYERELGIPAIRSPSGAPIGFSATEEWICCVARETGADPRKALGYLKELRYTAYHALSRYYNELGLVKGMSFSVKADASVALPLVRWLYTYLGMCPVAVRVSPDSDVSAGDALTAFLSDCGLETVLSCRPEDADADVFFGDGLTGMIFWRKGCCRSFVDMANEPGISIDVVAKTHLGGIGALYLLEQILNAANQIQYQNIFK